MPSLNEGERRAPRGSAGATTRGSRAARFTVWLDDVGISDLHRVGEKAATLGELRRFLGPLGVRIPPGFATTIEAYEEYLDADIPSAAWEHVCEGYPDLDEDVSAPASLRASLEGLFRRGASEGSPDAPERARLARILCLSTPVPQAIRAEIVEGYTALCRMHGSVAEVAVRRSSGDGDTSRRPCTGRHESLLNVRGAEAVLETWRRCAASWFTELAERRIGTGEEPEQPALAVLVMKMVHSDLATSGTLNTRDPDSGNRNVVQLTSAYGLGTPVVRGTVSPDVFVVWKEGVRRGRDSVVDRVLGTKRSRMVATSGDGSTRMERVTPAHQAAWSLTSREIVELARVGLLVEDRYGRPVDLEWAKDGYTGELYVVQARTAAGAASAKDEIHRMAPDLVRALISDGRLRTTGQAVGSAIGAGRVRRYRTYGEILAKERRAQDMVGHPAALSELPPADRAFDPGDVLVTAMTSPDWEPIMSRASLILTEEGGLGSHAAIVARRLGIPAIVDCGEALRELDTLAEVTGSCAEGDKGLVFEGLHPFERQRVPPVNHGTGMRLELDVRLPDKALHMAMLPTEGVGIARLDELVATDIGLHPLALAHHRALTRFLESGRVPDELPQLKPDDSRRPDLRALLDAATEASRTFLDPRSWFIDRLRLAVARLCAAFHPRSVRVRLSDGATEAYRQLDGADLLEVPATEVADDAMPRCLRPDWRAVLDMECEALRSVRQDMGMDNVEVLIPACASPRDARRLVEILDRHGLSPRARVPLHLMLALPSGAAAVDRFIEALPLSGAVIPLEDLITPEDDELAADAPSEEHAGRTPSVTKAVVRRAVERLLDHGLEVGACCPRTAHGWERTARFLMECGVTSLSVEPSQLPEARRAISRGRPRPGSRPPNGTRREVWSRGP